MRKISEKSLAERVAAGAAVDTHLSRRQPSLVPAAPVVDMRATVDESMQRVLTGQGQMLSMMFEELGKMRDSMRADASPKTLKVVTYRDNDDNLCAEIEVVEREEP